MLTPASPSSVPKRADEARLVLVAHVEHVRRELGLDLDVPDLDDARLAVLEHRAAGMARHVLGLDGDAHEALVVARRVLALHLLDHDAALLRDHRRRDHVDVLEERPQHAGQGRRGQRLVFSSATAPSYSMRMPLIGASVSWPRKAPSFSASATKGFSRGASSAVIEGMLRAFWIAP